MSRKNDETLSLLASHARLKLAADLIRWAINAESAKIIDPTAMKAIAENLASHADELFNAAMKR